MMILLSNFCILHHNHETIARSNRRLFLLQKRDYLILKVMFYSIKEAPKEGSMAADKMVTEAHFTGQRVSIYFLSFHFKF